MLKVNNLENKWDIWAWVLVGSYPFRPILIIPNRAEASHCTNFRFHSNATKCERHKWRKKDSIIRSTPDESPKQPEDRQPREFPVKKMFK